MSAGGDGIHPGKSGNKVLGQFVSDTLSGIISTYPSTLIKSSKDTSVLIANPLFGGTPVDGLAPSVFVYGSLPAGCVATVTAADGVAGKLQRLTHTTTLAEANVAQRIPSGSFSEGDVIEVSGIVTASGISAKVQVEFGSPPWGNKALAIDVDVTKGVFNGRFIVPPGHAAFIDLLFTTGPGTGYAELGQLTARNLTALGIA